MITDADIDKKLSIHVKAIDQAQVEITSLLINFSSQFDDEHQEQYAQAMSLIKNRFDENLMLIGAWLTTPNRHIGDIAPIHALSSIKGTQSVIRLMNSSSITQ